MKGKVIKISLFKDFKIEYDGQEVVLNHLLGKTLVNLFEYLIIHMGENVSLNMLEKNLWPESENPREVIKYTVFRLRKALAEINSLKGIDFVKTTDDGYMLNDAYNYEVDCLRLEEVYKEYGKKNDIEASDYKKIDAAVELYKGRFFLTNNSPMEITLEAERYSSYFSGLIVLMSKYLVKKGNYSKMMELNHGAILIEPFYEGLHYYYIKGLIEAKDYHQALKYYDEINEKFYEELGMGLSPQFKELYDMIVDDKEDDKKQEIGELRDDIERHVKESGGFYCTYEVFKHLYEITLKNAKRENKRCFLILISLSKNIIVDERISVSNKLKRIIEESIRSNDIFSRPNKSQFVMLLCCRELDNAYDVISRITSKYYKKFSSDKYRLNYSVQEVTDYQED